MFKHAFEQPDPLLEKAPTSPRRWPRWSCGAGHRPDRAAGRARRPSGWPSPRRAPRPGARAGSPPTARPVMGASSIVAATERASGPPAGPTVEKAPVHAAAGPAPATVPRHAAGASATVAKPPTTPVRPTVTVHTHSAALDEVTEGAADLVPVKEVLTPPPNPARYFIAAAVLVVVAFVVALVGIGAPSSGGTIPAGQVRVAGTDVVSGGTVHGRPLQARPRRGVPLGAGGRPRGAVLHRSRPTGVVRHRPARADRVRAHRHREPRRPLPRRWQLHRQGHAVAGARRRAGRRPSTPTRHRSDC